MTRPTDLYRLTAELRELGRGFEKAAVTLLEPAQGTDAAVAVTVTLDADGRVSAVHPSTRWRDLVAADQFGDAVVEAAQAAQVNRLDRWSSVLDEQQVPGDERQQLTDDDGGSDIATDLAAAASVVDLDALRADAPYVDLLALMDEATATLDHVMASAIDNDRTDTGALSGVDSDGLDPEATRTDPAADPDEAATTIGARPVVVHLDRSGALTQVDLELRWLAGADRGRVARALTDAFGRAYASYDARTDGARAAAGPAAPSGPSALSPQLAEVVRNPAGVLAVFARHL